MAISALSANLNEKEFIRSMNAGANTVNPAMKEKSGMPMQTGFVNTQPVAFGSLTMPVQPANSAVAPKEYQYKPIDEDMYHQAQAIVDNPALQAYINEMNAEKAIGNKKFVSGYGSVMDREISPVVAGGEGNLGARFDSNRYLYE